MAEETKVEETKPEEPEHVEDAPKSDEPEKSDESKDSEPDAEPEAESVESVEEMGAAEKFGVAQPPAISDTVFVPASFAKDGVTALKAAGIQYTRADQFGRAAILHSDRVNAGGLLARPTYGDRQVVDGDLNFVPVVGSGANNPPR